MSFLADLKRKFLGQDQGQILRVEGMKCAHCKATVEKTARKFPGIEWAEVDLDKGELHYGAKEPIDLLGLKQALQEAGFNPK
ncbi:MAG: heavy-metal-associated domain-containing protein [Desulfovibrionaceae bacterium]|nr:heavy-metal-associated domain-containing protein [Desulfovibrionaceae bacterium]